jgi:integrase
MTTRLLAYRRDSFKGPQAPVFPSARGLPFSPLNLGRDVLHPAREAAGLPWVTFHGFRHTCASLLFDAGRNVKQVSEWLGHTDPSFTLRTYVHLMDAGIGDAAFFDEAVGAARAAAIASA